MTADRHFVELFIKALKRHYGVNRDDELAIKLGVAKSTLSSWRRRVQIPKEIADKGFALGINVSGLANIAQLEHSMQQSLLRKTYYYIILKLSAVFGEDRDDLESFAGWLAQSEKMVCHTLGIGHSIEASELSLTEANVLWETTFLNDTDVVEKLWEAWQLDQTKFARPLSRL